jgi:hypothetical protein
MRFKMRTGLKTETQITITDETQDENRIENWHKIVITDETQDENRIENWHKIVITDDTRDENRIETETK